MLVGPFIGGAIVQYLHWRAIFFGNLPLGVLAFVVAARWAPRDRPQGSASRFDITGAAVLTVAVFTLVAAPPELAGTAAGLQQTVLMISGSLGAAIFGSIITASAPGFAGHAVATDQLDGYLTGFGHATQLGAVLTFLAALTAAAALRPSRT